MAEANGRVGPCAGLRVLDLSTMVSGPMAGQIFADLGADVVKLEAIEGDTVRQVFPHHEGMGAYFTHFNRNKRSIAVDLKLEEGKAIARRLALKADVLIENFRPGVPQRLGLGYEDLRSENPGLVYIAIKGFGEDGPYKNQPAYDQVIQALTGFMVIQGKGGEPLPVRNPVVDKIAAMSAAVSGLAALWSRDRNQRNGQKIVVKMLDAWAAFISQEEMKNHTFLSATVPPPPLRDLYRVFKTRDGHVMGFIVQDSQFRGICATVGRNDLLEDPRFAKPGDRMKNVSLLHDELTDSIAAMTTHDFLESVRRLEVPMGNVNTLEELFEDPQAIHNETFLRFSDPTFGDMRCLNFFATFDGTSLNLRARGPMLGEHTDEILGELGHSEADVSKLREDAVIR
ncbi:CoA transferase [Bradyrhizobium tropiciagri]|uniref:CaiB/BaiF CoA transferase family protein n=1 Tax=Bradyrhizobium tropiciagri TaxID=312253 RepID=UPI001BA74B4E|nr:CoA transferase [Bradyrhizobium tropiciagri]MBR0898895.1 CoA transferase [Bradyrhizobium tropiciagri]